MKCEKKVGIKSRIEDRIPKLQKEIEKDEKKDEDRAREVLTCEKEPGGRGPSGTGRRRRRGSGRAGRRRGGAEGHAWTGPLIELTSNTHAGLLQGWARREAGGRSAFLLSCEFGF